MLLFSRVYSDLLTCDPAAESRRLAISDNLYGLDIADLVTVQVRIDPDYQDVFAYPSERHHTEARLTQADFQAIADAARAFDEEELARLRATSR